MIRLEHLSKQFRSPAGQHVIACDLTETFKSGECVALLGQNGAGKTTLLRLISGELRPDRGRVIRRGRVSWPVGFAGGLHPDMTGTQNARFVARIYRRDPQGVVRFCRHVSGLGPQIDRPVRKYSQGMRARLAFALSMAIPFDFYLFDEITAVGDAAFRAQCINMIRDRASKAGAIIATHSPPVVRSLCSSAVVLENGHLHRYADVEAALGHHNRLAQASA